MNPDGTPSMRVICTTLRDGPDLLAVFTPEHPGPFPADAYLFGWRGGVSDNLYVRCPRYERLPALAAADYLMDLGYTLSDRFLRYFARVA